MERSPRETKETPETTLEELAIWTVNAFDQANTNQAIRSLGSRGIIVFDAVNELRNFLNADSQKTILTEEQVSPK